MTRNQLKLRIWNSLNGKFLNDEMTDSLIKGLDDTELGAFIDLYADSRCGRVFLDIKSKEQDGIAFFTGKEAKEAIGKYVEILKNGYLSGMRKRVFLVDFEEIIHSLADDVAAEEECGRASEARMRLLDFCRVLRTKIDSPSIETADAEAALFEALKLNYEGALLYDAFMVIEMFIEEIHDVEKLSEIYETHNLALEVYIQEIDNSFGCLFRECLD